MSRTSQLGVETLMLRLSTTVGALLLATVAPTQIQPVSYTDVALPNTGAGTPLLACRVWYPSTQSGANQPLVQKQGGWPVILHLHGSNNDGKGLIQMASTIAAAGFLVFMQDTSYSSSTGQYNDAIALIPALNVANANPAFFFYAQLDTQRLGLQGYSMGAGNTINVLAARPEFKDGVCFSPTSQTASSANVKVPILLFNGLGDTSVNPSTSINNYNAMANYTGVKVVLRYNGACNHGTMVADPVSAPDNAIFGRTLKMAIGFHKTWLAGSADGFEEIAGGGPQTDPYRDTFLMSEERPITWWTWYDLPTHQVRMKVLTEPGQLVFLFASLGHASIPTNYGTLGLDPATMVFIGTQLAPGVNVATFGFPVPEAQVTLGRVFPMQSLSMNRPLQWRLSNVADLRAD